MKTTLLGASVAGSFFCGTRVAQYSRDLWSKTVKPGPVTDASAMFFCTKSLELVQNDLIQQRTCLNARPNVLLEILLTQAARGRRITLQGDCLEWVKRLIDSGHLTTEFIPSEQGSELRVRITDKGRAL